MFGIAAGDIFAKGPLSNPVPLRNYYFFSVEMYLKSSKRKKIFTVSFTFTVKLGRGEGGNLSIFFF